MHKTPSWESRPSLPFPHHPLTPTRAGLSFNKQNLEPFSPFLFFRALAIIEKSKSTSISVAFISEFEAAFRELMPPGWPAAEIAGPRGLRVALGCHGAAREPWAVTM